MFFRRVGRNTAVNTAVLPYLTKNLQRIARTSGFAAAADAPLHIAAPCSGRCMESCHSVAPHWLVEVTHAIECSTVARSEAQAICIQACVRVMVRLNIQE